MNMGDRAERVRSPVNWRLFKVVLKCNTNSISFTDVVLAHTLKDFLPLGGYLIQSLLWAQLASKRLGGAGCHRW